MTTKLLKDNQGLLILRVIIYSVALPLIAGWAALTFYPDIRWKSIAFHSSLESLGGMIALSVAGVLLLGEKEEADKTHHFFVSSALLSMGLLDIFHAMVDPGKLFVWLHTTATFFGGLFFGFVWTPHILKGYKIPISRTSVVVVVILLFSAGSFLFPQAIPPMVRNGGFSFPAKFLHYAGALVFYLATICFIYRFKTQNKWEDYLFALHCGLFGTASIIFELSKLWDMTWWLWHVLRLFAYLAALTYAVHLEVRGIRIGESFLTSIIEGTDDGVIGSDLNGKIISWNKGAEKIYGYSNKEVVGKNILVVYPEDRKRENKMFIDRIRQGNMVNNFETIRVKKNGTRIHASLTVSPIRNESGEIIGASSIIRDISERKLYEQEILRAREDAEKANKAKSIFLANMSHEIRTPMNAVLGYSQILLRNRSLDEETRDSLKVIEKSGKNLLNMINEILDISKIEAGKMELHQSDFNLAELIKELETLFHFRCQEKHINWEVNGFDSPVWVLGDEQKIKQILINLLGNAIKFTESGSVSLKVRSINENLYRFDIKDTGIGIPFNEQKRIFDAFHQDDHGSKKGGTGLGLSIAKSQLELMESDLFFESKENEGAHFYFTLRLPSSRESLSKNNATENLSVLHLAEGCEVSALIADDVEENRNLLAKLLTDIGVKVYFSGNGKETFEIAQRLIPDIIFMDMKMPLLRGDDAIKFIRKDQTIKEVKVVAITASTIDRTRNYYLDLGFDEYISKPFKLNQIFDCLKNLLQIEFIYEEVPSTNPEFYTKKEYDLSQINLPEDLVKKMRIAASLYNITELEACVIELINQNKVPEHVGKFFSSLIDHYDMEGIMESLEKVKAS